MHQTPQPHRLIRCELCGRIPKKGTTEHHLIPRCCHRNKWFKKRFSREEMNRTISVCWDCHRAIHAAVPSEKELGRHYNSVTTLMQNGMIAGFVDWVSRRR